MRSIEPFYFLARTLILAWSFELWLVNACRNDEHVNHSHCYRTLTRCALCIPNLTANHLHHRFWFCRFIVRFQAFDELRFGFICTRHYGNNGSRDKRKKSIRGSNASIQYNLKTLWFRFFLFSPSHSHFTFQ